jgi:mRNA interferase MazF
MAEPPRLLQGREQMGRRPVLVVSVDQINHGPAGLSVVVPFTTRDRGLPLHVVVDPPEGGLSEHSVLMTEQIHAADNTRFTQLVGRVSDQTLRQVEDRLRIVLDLD